MERYPITHETKHKFYHKAGKRCLSAALSVVALPFVGLSWLVVAPAIKLEDGGSVFYASERLGLDGRVFKMYKYRSMRMNAPVLRSKDGVSTIKEGDPRVTKVGRFIRKFGIDELPQIFNVLKGDMSFIGPRPDLPDTIDRLTGVIPNPLADITPENFYEDVYKERMSVRPGITGYGPIYLPRGTNRVDKDTVDAWYAENMSFALDAKVFFGTIKHLLTGRHR